MGMPQVELVAGSLAQSAADVVATAVRRVDGRPRVSAATTDLVAGLGADVELALERGSATGAAGQLTEVPRPTRGDGPDRVLLVGVGDDSPADLRKAGAALARRARGAEVLATDILVGLDADAARAHVEGLLLASYGFSRRSRPAAAPFRVELAVPARAASTGRTADAVRRAVVTAGAAWESRDLANTPSNEKSPAWLARRARDLARRAGLDVTVHDEKTLAAEGFGGLLGVGGGSARPPRLVELRYRPRAARRGGPHVVLVGKGITFDTGGLSLKPRKLMVPMKTDMTGAGSVLAAMAALRDLDVRVRVTGLLALAENMPGAAALRIGDVIRHYGGRTVEVFNTDAEGRLVLADALAYADAQLDPDVLVDVATLTGAASRGLGRRHAALYTADADLLAGLLAAGEDSGERCWQLPLVDDYRAALDSEVADLANVSRDPKVSGGSILAALFLREFAGGRRWAHLDIAGPARADRDEHEVTRGGTGFGVRLLLRWLEALSAGRAR